MSEHLGTPHKATLFALMGSGREVSNPELNAMVGLTIRKEVRERLVSLRLITARTRGNTYWHALTGKGWDWCLKELSAGEIPPRPGSLGRALYAILDGLERHLRERHIQLTELFQQDADAAQVSPDGLKSHIRTAYQRLAKEPSEWVRLADLRAELKNDVDALLRQMSRDRQVHLEPDSNRKMLTEADHAAAIRIGGDDNHLIAIEES